MLSWEIIQSILFIAVLTALIVGYGIVLARKEDREAAQQKARPTNGERLAS